MEQTILIRVTGIDKPGITAGILRILAQVGADVLDMEQVVVRDRLNLGLLISVAEERAPLKDLLFFGWERSLHFDFEVVDPPENLPAPSRFAVTVIGERLGPEALGGVADAIADGGGNIERIVRLSNYPVISYELIVMGGHTDTMRKGLLEASSLHRIDIAMQKEGLARRATRLVVIDMDSTLIRDEVIDLLADEVGDGDEVRGITDDAMNGRLDFEASLRRRVARLEGMDVARLQAVTERIRYTPGARTFARTLRRLGYRTALVSGGFDMFAEEVRRHLGIDLAFANTLEVVDGRLTGRLVGEVIDGAAKARLLETIAAGEGIPLEQTVAIGDGSNDLAMLAKAGLGIAFNAKPIVDAAADTTLKVPYLDAILFVLGIRRQDIEAADRADG
ncbi:MAG: phosphoserine phosphatase SerB [Acidimicrobiia bacterium]